MPDELRLQFKIVCSSKLVLQLIHFLNGLIEIVSSIYHVLNELDVRHFLSLSISNALENFRVFTIFLADSRDTLMCDSMPFTNNLLVLS